MRDFFTLPMIWLDGSSSKFWLVGTPLVGLVLVSALCARPKDDGGDNNAWWTHPLFFIAFLGLAILYFRLPTITSRYSFIEDESIFLAGTITLMYDPVFWRSVQSTSSGPLTYYVLLLPKLVGLPLDFLSARLVGAGLLFVMLMVHYAWVARLFGDRLARLTTLPIWATLAFVTYEGLVNYHSEQVPMLLLQLASYCLYLFWISAKPGWTSMATLAAAGMLLGWLPWAKFQAVPAGLGVALLGAGAVVARDWRSSPRVCLANSAVFVLAGLAPTLLFFLYAWCLDVWESMWFSYIRWNFELAGKRTGYFSWGEKIRDLPRALFTVPSVREFSGWWLATFVLALARLSLRRSAAHWRMVLFPGLLAVVPLLLLGFAILVSGTVLAVSFTHYLLFLLFPLAMLQACCLGLANDGRPGHFTFFVCVVLIAAALQMAGTRWAGDERYLNHADYYHEPFLLDAVVNDIFVYSGPDDCILVWGWAPRYHALTQRRQATPFAGTDQETGYLRDLYVQRIRANRPALIIDEVGDKSLVYQDRKLFGHETMLDLKQVIDDDYALVRDEPLARVYVRQDILDRLPVPELISVWDFTAAVTPADARFNRQPCFGVEIANRGKKTWYAHGKDKVTLMYQIDQQPGRLMERAPIYLGQAVAPGESTKVYFEAMSVRPPGDYGLKLNLVQGAGGKSSKVVAVPFRMDAP